MKKWIFTGILTTVILTACFLFVRSPEKPNKITKPEPEKTLVGTSTTASPYIHKIIGDPDIWNMCERTELYSGDILDFSNTPAAKVRDLHNKRLQQVFFIEKDSHIISVTCADAQLLAKPKSTKSVINGHYIFRSTFGSSYEMTLKQIESFPEIQNPDAFDYIDDSFYLTDGINVYHQQGTSTPTLVLIEGADPHTFTPNTGFVDSATDSGAIYIAGKRYPVDQETFKPLIFDFYSDKNGYYQASSTQQTKDSYGGFVLDTLVSVKEEDVYLLKPFTPTSTDWIGITGYVINGPSVYYGHITSVSSTTIKGADPESLFIIRNNYDGMGKYGAIYRYAKDKDNAYFEGNIIPGTDPKTFKPIGFQGSGYSYPYMKDKNHVYYENRVIDKADPNTFETLSGVGGYAKDAERIYFKETVMVGADYESFELISKNLWLESYTRDKNHIYYADAVIDGIDSESFEILDGWYSKDKNGIYFKGKLDPSLPLDFVPPGEG